TSSRARAWHHGDHVIRGGRTGGAGLTTHARASAALPVIPVLAAAAVGVRMSFGPGLTVGLIVAVVLIPVWVPAMRRYRSLGWWMVIGVIAVVGGVLLTALDTSRETSSTVLLSESLT